MSLLREEPARMVASFTENGVSRFGLRDTHFSYVYTPQTENEQLFDEVSDPGQAHNLSPQEPAITTRYRTRLQRWEAVHELSLASVLR